MNTKSIDLFSSPNHISGMKQALPQVMVMCYLTIEHLPEIIITRETKNAKLDLAVIVRIRGSKMWSNITFCLSGIAAFAIEIVPHSTNDIKFKYYLWICSYIHENMKVQWISMKYPTIVVSKSFSSCLLFVFL